VFLAEVICSDDRCDLVSEAIGEFHELELLVCEGCGCCLQVVALSAYEAVELRARVAVEPGPRSALARAA
jgi:hypothetical protein